MTILHRDKWFSGMTDDHTARNTVVDYPTGNRLRTPANRRTEANNTPGANHTPGLLENSKRIIVWYVLLTLPSALAISDTMRHMPSLSLSLTLSLSLFLALS